MDPKWKVDTISTAARYQIDDFPIVWSKDENESIDFSRLKPGDTLFWQGVESGDIVHTAIYLGNEMMVETMNTVRIVKVREYTHGGEQEDSQLVQINRMTPEGLNDNYEKNTH
jgi:cell wall-associated NlpC family hydrolase